MSDSPRHEPQWPATRECSAELLPDSTPDPPPSPMTPDEIVEHCAIESRLLMAVPDVARELYRQLTEALYPFGPAGEVPTEPGDYDVLRNGNVCPARLVRYRGNQHMHWLWIDAYSHSRPAPRMVKLASVDGMRFAGRPTRKPPTP